MIIRKLSITDPKEGLSFVVGQTLLRGSKNEVKIISINKDESYFYEYGKIRYDIWVEKRIDSKVYKWKSLEDISVVLEYELSDLS